MGETHNKENEKIERLEKDLEKLKTSVEGSSLEMNKTVEDLRKAVIDIRSAVSEIENPFNLLRVITNEKDLDRMNKAQPLVEKIKIREETANIEEPKFEAKPGEEVKEVTEKPPDKEEVKEAGLESTTFPNFKYGSSLVSWIYTMLDLGFDQESLRSICQYCEYIGLIPKGSSIYVSNLVGAIIEARANGLSEEEVILGIYTVAKAAGTKIKPDDTSEVLIQILKRSRLEKLVK